jgi:hypothetical protein
MHILRLQQVVAFEGLTRISSGRWVCFVEKLSRSPSDWRQLEFPSPNCGCLATLRSGTEIISRLRVVSFRMAEVMAGSWRENGEAVFRLVPRGKGNAMRPKLSKRDQAPALHSGANPRSRAHFGVRRLDAALSPRELAATSERRSLPCNHSTQKSLMTVTTLPFLKMTIILATVERRGRATSLRVVVGTRRGT